MKEEMYVITFIGFKPPNPLPQTLNAGTYAKNDARLVAKQMDEAKKKTEQGITRYQAIFGKNNRWSRTANGKFEGVGGFNALTWWRGEPSTGPFRVRVYIQIGKAKELGFQEWILPFTRNIITASGWMIEDEDRFVSQN